LPNERSFAGSFNEKPENGDLVLIPCPNFFLALPKRIVSAEELAGLSSQEHGSSVVAWVRNRLPRFGPISSAGIFRLRRKSVGRKFDEA
jgi:hypothetical protein